ncbi:PTS sugar transporter subunit IIB, partial [Mycobacterium tuberculosis]|nr:PTS sugar transporter subunit IIB [Mycobacterium tuberculosis]
IWATGIVMVGDKLSEDSFLAAMFVMGEPPGVRVNVLSEEAFISGVRAGQYDNGKDNVLLLFKSIGNLRHLIEQDVNLPTVQI